MIHSIALHFDNVSQFSWHNVADHEFAEQLGWVLLHSVWQFTAIALLVFLVDRFWRNSSPSLRYVGLLVALMCMLAAPCVTWSMLPGGTTLYDATSDAAMFQEPSNDRADPIVSADIADIQAALNLSPHEPSPAIELPETTLLLQPVAVAEPVSWTSRLSTVLQPWLGTIVSLWCCGVLLFSVRLLLGWRAVTRLKTLGVNPVGEAVEQSLQRIRKRLKIGQRVQVLQSTLVNSPVVVGCFRSVILLPSSFLASAPVSQIEAILAHELAHVRRFDYVVNLLQTMIETLFFYHPAVWWLSNRIRVERENCCDDLVVATLNNRIEYGRALLAVEEYRGQAALLSLAARKGSLLARVHRLLSNPDAQGQRNGTGLVGLGFLCMGLLAAGFWIAFSARAVEGDENEVKTGDEQSFVAQVGDEILVELVAVLPDGAKVSKAWRPDGSTFDEPPMIGEDRNSPGRGDETHNLVVKFLGLKRSQGATYRLSGLRTAWNRDGNGLARLSANLSDAKRPVTLRVGITDVQWGPLQSVDVRGNMMQPVDVPTACREVYDQIKPDHIEERVNAFVFCWFSLSSQDDRAQARVFAVDKDGERHAPDGATLWSTDDGDFNADVFDIPIGQIDHFEYQLRPYRHWITFENVSVDPGEETDVKLSVTTVATGYAAQALTDRVITRIDQQRLPYVSSKHLAVLRRELIDYLDARVPNHVDPALLQSILQAVDAYVPARFIGPESYLNFRGNFDMLKWRIWTATERLELTPQQLTRRETQREWMRDQIRSLPPANTGTRVPTWTHQGRLDVLESEIFNNNVLNPFIHDPMTDAEFKRFQKLLGDRIYNRRSVRSRRKNEPEDTGTVIDSQPRQNALVHSPSWIFQTIVQARLAGRRKRWPPGFAAGGLGTGGTEHFSFAANTSGIAGYHIGRHGDSWSLFDAAKRIPVMWTGTDKEFQQREKPGDLWFDPVSSSLHALRNAKLAVIKQTHWYEVDRLSLGELKQRIAKQNRTEYSLAADAARNPAQQSPQGVYTGPQFDKAVRELPTFVLETADGDVFVFRIAQFNSDVLFLHLRHRPLLPYPPFHAGDVGSSEGPTEESDATPSEKPKLDSRNVQRPTQPAFKLQVPGRRSVMSVGFSDDSSTLLTHSASGNDGRIHTWDVATRKETNTLVLAHARQSWLSGTDFVMSVDSTRVARVIGRQIKIWDVKSGELLKTLTPPERQQLSKIRGLSASADFSRIACGHHGADVSAGLVDPNANPVVWDTSTGEVIQVMKGQIAARSTALSPDGKWLAAANWGLRFTVLDVATGGERYTVRNDNTGRKHPDSEVSEHSKNMVLNVSFSPDGSTLVAGDLLGVKLYDAATGKLKKRLPHPFRSGSGGLVFSPDGKMLARVGTDKMVPIWSTQSGELLAELPTKSDACSFSPDGQWFAVGRSDKTDGIAVWRLRAALKTEIETSADSVFLNRNDLDRVEH